MGRIGIGAVISACVGISVVIFGVVLARETTRSVRPPAVAEIKAPRLIVEDRHLTEWQGMSGGATLDAKPVKSVVIPVSRPLGDITRQ